MVRSCAVGICLLAFASFARAQSDGPLLIRHPTLSRDKIAFWHAGDIWTVARGGGDAVRLTAGIGEKGDPHYSPDGAWLAFTADYYGNPDVFVIPAAGGEPRRLTAHPAVDIAVGWTPDGKSVLFGVQPNQRDRSAEAVHRPDAGRISHRIDIRNLTASPGVADRDPSWSPDGKRIAWFSDESGEYALHIREQNGQGEVTKVALGAPASLFLLAGVVSRQQEDCLQRQAPQRLVRGRGEKGTPVKVDTDYYDTPFHSLNPSWSPDGKWLVYTKQLKSHMHAAFVYEVSAAKATQITDGFSDALYAAWDKGGKYLYLTASTNVGLSASWLDLSSVDHPITRSPYVLVLSANDPSPLAPESDEEKPDAAAKPEDGKGREGRERQTEGAANSADRLRGHRAAYSRAPHSRAQLRRPVGGQGRGSVSSRGAGFLRQRRSAASDAAQVRSQEAEDGQAVGRRHAGGAVRERREAAGTAGRQLENRRERPSRRNRTPKR